MKSHYQSRTPYHMDRGMETLSHASHVSVPRSQERERLRHTRRSDSRSRSVESSERRTHERAWVPPVGRRGRRDQDADHSALERLGQNLSETKGLLGHLKCLSGQGDAFLVTRDRSRERTTTTHDTLERLMARFLEGDTTNSGGIVGAYERWQAFLATRVREIATLQDEARAAADTAEVQRREATRGMAAYRTLRTAHTKLAACIAPDHPPLPTHDDHHQSLASLLSDEADVVDTLRSSADAMLATLRDRIHMLAAEVSRADDTYDRERTLEDRAEEGLVDVAAAVDALRSSVLTSSAHREPALLDIDPSEVRDGLGGEVDRLHVIIRYIEHIGSIHDSTTALSTVSHLEQKLRSANSELADQQTTTNNLEELLHQRTTTLSSTEAELTSAKKRITQLEGVCEDVRGRNDDEQDHYDSLLAECTALRGRNAKLHSEIRELRDGANTASTEALYDEVDTLTRELHLLRETTRRSESEASHKAQHLLQEERSLREASDATVASLQSEVSRLKQTLAANTQSGVDDLYDEIYALKQELQHKDDPQRDLAMDDMEGEIVYLKGEISRLELKEGGVDTQNRETQTADDDDDSGLLRQQLDDMTREYEAIAMQLQHTMAELEATTTQLEDVREGDECAQSEVEALSLKLQEMEDALREREVQLQDAYDELNGDAALKEQNVELTEKVVILEESVRSLEARLHAMSTARPPPAAVRSSSVPSIEPDEPLLLATFPVEHTTQPVHRTSPHVHRSAPVKKRSFKRQKYPFLGLELGSLRVCFQSALWEWGGKALNAGSILMFATK